MDDNEYMSVEIEEIKRNVQKIYTDLDDIDFLIDSKIKTDKIFVFCFSFAL